jgi:hypothetical protein
VSFKEDFDFVPTASLIVSDTIWFFFPSREFSLSKTYTNNSLRATTVHALDAAQIPGRLIMTVAGHTSETSLKNIHWIYGRKFIAQFKALVLFIFCTVLLDCGIHVFGIGI